MFFLIERVFVSSIMTLRHNLTLYNHFFEWSFKQINNVINNNLFSWASIHKKCLYEVKICFIVSIEAQVRSLNKKFINPGKMLISVNLMYVVPWNKLGIVYPL